MYVSHGIVILHNVAGLEAGVICWCTPPEVTKRESLCGPLPVTVERASTVCTSSLLQNSNNTSEHHGEADLLSSHCQRCWSLLKPREVYIVLPLADYV